MRHWQNKWAKKIYVNWFTRRNVAKVHWVILISNREISHAMTHIYRLFLAEMQESAGGRWRGRHTSTQQGKGALCYYWNDQPMTASLCEPVASKYTHKEQVHVLLMFWRLGDAVSSFRRTLFFQNKMESFTVLCFHFY